MATYVEDIIQALKNLGGQARLEQIYDEVKRIRTVPQTKNWKFNISGIIGNHCSDSTRFLGKDYFRKVDSGTYALRDHVGENLPKPIQTAKKAREPHSFSMPESFETVFNTLRTIKEYRDYSDPASIAWTEYIQEIFHIIGFNTQQKDSRLFLLTDMGKDNTPKAIVAYNLPSESFEEILPELKWDYYLFLAANYHQVEWGILTNGLRIKVINFHTYKDSKPFFETDFDEIIKNEKSESFFALYKVFSNIKNSSGLP